MIQWQPSDSDPGQTGRGNAHGNERLQLCDTNV